MDKEKHEMMRAERAALEACPPDMVKTMHGEVDFNEAARAFFLRGYRKEEARVNAAKVVLDQRVKILTESIQLHPDEKYLKGKQDGYREAIELLNSSEESIKVELV